MVARLIGVTIRLVPDDFCPNPGSIFCIVVGELRNDIRLVLIGKKTDELGACIPARRNKDDRHADDANAEERYN